MRDKSERGMSRGRRGMFLRIPEELHEKLRRMVTAELVKGNAQANINNIVIGLISQAKEPKRAT